MRGQRSRPCTTAHTCTPVHTCGQVSPPLARPGCGRWRGGGFHWRGWWGPVQPANRMKSKRGLQSGSGLPESPLEAPLCASGSAGRGSGRKGLCGRTREAPGPLVVPGGSTQTSRSPLLGSDRAEPGRPVPRLRHSPGASGRRTTSRPGERGPGGWGTRKLHLAVALRPALGGGPHG